MPFEQCWRWFGPNDPVSLSEVKQTGATGVVTALHHIPTGEIWPVDEILARKRDIEKEGLRWSVAESLPVHEGIKLQTPDSRRLLENYKTSIKNLGTCGIRTICYNFMPVLDWSRTSLETSYTDGSITTSFHSHILAAFDLFILKRAGAEHDYDTQTRRNAEEYFLSLDEGQKDHLTKTILLGFPGSGETYTADELRTAIRAYQNIDTARFRRNLTDFLEGVVPVAETAGVRLALHPDDPPWPLLGLPRVVSSSSDIVAVLDAVESPSNGIALCTGSLGAGRKNNVVAIAQQFAPHINFVHLRNVSLTGESDFLESDHLKGDVDMYGVVRALLLEQHRREVEGRTDSQIPMRPDHGHRMDAEPDNRYYYPGYSLFGRMRGLAELRGLELGIRQSLGI